MSRLSINSPGEASCLAPTPVSPSMQPTATESSTSDAIAKHATAMGRGATWGRDVLNLVRVPLQIPLAGVPQLSAQLAKEPRSWKSTLLHEGVLGVLGRTTRYAAASSGALAGTLAGVCGAGPKRVETIQDGTARALDGLLVAPVTHARHGVCLLGAHAADVAARTGALTGLAFGLVARHDVFKRRQVAAQKTSFFYASPPGDAVVTHLSNEIARGMAAEVHERVVEQLGPGVPKLQDIDIHLGHRKELRALDDGDIFSASRSAQRLHYESRGVLGQVSTGARVQDTGWVTLELFPANLRRGTYDDVRRVIHHEMVHLWQFARYPDFVETHTVAQDVARLRWLEGHAVLHEQQAQKTFYPQARRLGSIAGWRLRMNPEIYAHMLAKRDDIYGKGLDVMRAVHERPDAHAVQHLAFSNPSLVDMLCGADAQAPVTLLPGFDTPHNRALVDDLRSLSISVLRANQAPMGK